MTTSRFEIIRKLGQGGMGEVLLAEDRHLGRRVALKSITVIGTGQKEAEQRFLRESRIMAGIRHPSLLQVYDVVQEDERLIMVMEFVEGRDLEQVLKISGVLPLSRVLQLAGELAPALDALHARGVLHRDIKPANIMIRAENGQALLMDLGLAREEGGTVMTRTGSILGTPLYMPPEVVLGKDWNLASDQFQLAAVLFRAATGKNHVGGEGVVELFQNISSAAWTPFPLAPQLPVKFREGLQRGLSLDPEDRPTSGIEFLRDLSPEETGKFQAASATVPGGFSQLVERLPRKLGLASGILILLLIGAWIGLSAPSIRDVHWKTTGERIEVSFESEDPAGVYLEVAGVRRVSPVHLGASRWALRFDHLVPGQEEKAVLRYGSRDLEVYWVQGEEPALEVQGHPLSSGPGLGLKIRRACQASLEGGSGAWVSLEPGIGSLPLLGLPGEVLPRELLWREEEANFAQSLDWKTLLEDQLKRLFEELRDVDVDSALRASAPRIAGSPLGSSSGASFEEYRRLMRGVRDWIPWLLSAQDLEWTRRRRLLRLWQVWSRSVAQAVIQGRDGIQPLQVPEGLPGSLMMGIPGWVSYQTIALAPRHSAGDRGKGYLALDTYLDGRTDLLEKRQTTKIIDLEWPQRAPQPGEWVCLSVRVTSMEQWSQLEVFEPGGDFQVFMWQPRPRAFVNTNDIEGWISVVLPVDLAPASGAKLEMRCRSLLSPQIQSAKIFQVRVSWKEAPQPLTK